MKQIFIATILVALVTGCHTNSRNAGNPADPSYSETGGKPEASYQDQENDRHVQSRVNNKSKYLPGAFR